MHDMTDAQQGVADIWPYVDSLVPQDVGVTRIGDVAYVYRDGAARYDHILLETEQEDTFLAIVFDLGARAILGHHLLDLKIKYGLATKQ